MILIGGDDVEEKINLEDLPEVELPDNFIWWLEFDLPL